MSTCTHCGQRKGKRSCPALAGAICSRCCGQHRLVEIACPSDCVHLGGLAVVRDPSRAVPFTRADHLSAWDKLQAFAVSATGFDREAAARLGGGTRWDPSIALAYVHYGHRGVDGSRMIERFLAARGRTLSAGEAAATVALQRARASLFEVVAVRTGVGLDLRDALSGETSHVREVTGSARLREHDVLFAWVMDFPDHRELTGAACDIERAHVERVRAALEAELPAARTRWPGIADADLVGSIAWAVFRALDAARDEEDARREAATEPPPPTFDDDDDDRDEDDDPGTGWSYDASTAPDPERWLTADELQKIAAIEAHHRALGVDLPNPRMHATMHAIVENQLAAGAPAEARATLERFMAAGVARHDAVHAIGSVVAKAIWRMLRRHETVDRDAMVAALARLDPEDWRDGEPEDEPPATIPPLAHEVMYRRVPGLRAAIEHAAHGMRQGGWTESTLLDPPQLLERSTIGEFLELHAAALMAAGWAREAAIDDADLLSIHAFNILTYELHRKKTFWVDESLAFMLGHTRLDVRGEGFRLPFPCFALVFTDRETLGLAEAVARTDPTASVCGLPLRGLTVYATQLPTTRGALGLHLAFLLDADTDSWPWLITRDLDIQPDDTLDDIIESRFADAVNPDPVFRTPELRQLVQLVVNAILFAGSSPAWPVVGSAASPAAAEPAGRPRRRRAPPPPPERSEEQIWHLPGKIPIRQVRALRQLQRDRDRGALFSRFMVRGHWRRAPGTWRDQAPRWIAPYWKGPPLGDIVERDYALKP
ncbi:MAG TPA: DUF1841 family protein [Kofleriaceae bacterium]